MSAGRSREVAVGGVRLHVEEHGSGTPVLLIHGWPDSGYLWRHQVPFLAGHGFRVIVPDMRGLGRSDRPPEVADYKLAKVIGDVAAVLDAAGVEAAYVVGHDWGAAVAWFTAMFIPDRSRSSPCCRSGTRVRRGRSGRTRWPGTSCSSSSRASRRRPSSTRTGPGCAGSAAATGDQERYLEDLSRPGALTASLNWYRANLAPRMPGTAPELPPVTAPTLGIWSDGDRYLDGERMEKSVACV